MNFSISKVRNVWLDQLFIILLLFFIRGTYQKQTDQPAVHQFPSRALQLCQQFPVRVLQIPGSTSDALINSDIWSNASCVFISNQLETEMIMLRVFYN